MAYHKPNCISHFFFFLSNPNLRGPPRPRAVKAPEPASPLPSLQSGARGPQRPLAPLFQGAKTESRPAANPTARAASSSPGHVSPHPHPSRGLPPRRAWGGGVSGVPGAPWALLHRPCRLRWWPPRRADHRRRGAARRGPRRPVHPPALPRKQRRRRRPRRWWWRLRPARRTPPRVHHPTEAAAALLPRPAGAHTGARRHPGAPRPRPPSRAAAPAANPGPGSGRLLRTAPLPLILRRTPALRRCSPRRCAALASPNLRRREKSQKSPSWRQLRRCLLPLRPELTRAAGEEEAPPPPRRPAIARFPPCARSRSACRCRGVAARGHRRSPAGGRRLSPALKPQAALTLVPG